LCVRQRHREVEWSLHIRTTEHFNGHDAVLHEIERNKSGVWLEKKVRVPRSVRAERRFGGIEVRASELAATTATNNGQILDLVDDICATDRADEIL
jgi:hypothetical protein